MKEKGLARYGLIENRTFGIRIVAGIVTGIRYTEDRPVYELSFGNDKWWTCDIFETIEELFKSLQIAPLEDVAKTHNLKIKYS